MIPVGISPSFFWKYPMENTVLDTDTVCEKAILVVSKTDDGSQLAPADLHLTESAANGFLTEKGVAAFEQLYQLVLNDQYHQPWLQDIEFLTVDHEGYIYWKGNQVEHYDYPYADDSRQDLEDLAIRCAHIESLGLTPTTTLVIWHWNRYKDLTNEHPWLAFLKKSPGIWTDDSTLLLVLSDRGVTHFIDQKAFHFDDIDTFTESKCIESNQTDLDSFFSKMTRAGFKSPQIGQTEFQSFYDVPLDNVINLLNQHGVPRTLFDEVD
jgi:hypothetical protein